MAHNKDANTMTAEDLQEAFYNFDEHKCYTLHMDVLKRIMVEEGEPIPDWQDFLQEAQQFSDGKGNVDYRALADMMMYTG
eukprot:CAMPEP_0201517884 /NCGR_PEP_ID=MMETSP0161_2-20130828/8874_1 /ASSEMBLY_ACC=CAM_ASM_000251 /TAXON_ID=180227 /ORGANISM="Neoparamoeba aestuarina, Strain SoJaBio B1-5/56/2" /LENGTH=79 /DNA_ID=CAMNT_0047915513 /DNA_START=49 /DNA_END=288 /DNA_ORIENTATION=+